MFHDRVQPFYPPLPYRPATAESSPPTRIVRCSPPRCTSPWDTMGISGLGSPSGNDQFGIKALIGMVIPMGIHSNFFHRDLCYNHEIRILTMDGMAINHIVSIDHGSYGGFLI